MGGTEHPVEPQDSSRTRVLENDAAFAGYVIEGVAGRGGMGIVYRARESFPARSVALKVLSPELVGDAEFRARFVRESNLAATIEHPNVLPIFRAGEEAGLLYLAMRYVEGTDLAAFILDRGRVEPRQAVDIIVAVCDALDAAHARGLVHRDVKPANVLLGRQGAREHVYLTDFGIAKHADATGGPTMTGSFLGTLDYAAPEQIRSGHVDARTDVYATGCLLFHALTGRVPFPADNAAARVFAHISAEPPSLADIDPSLPAGLDAVVAKAMAKDPNDRYLSAGDLGRAARAALEGQTPTRAERNVAVGTAVATAEPDDAPTVAGTPSPGNPPAIPTDEDPADSAPTIGVDVSSMPAPAEPEPAGVTRQRRVPWKVPVAILGAISFVAASVFGVAKLQSNAKESRARARLARLDAAHRRSDPALLALVPVHIRSTCDHYSSYDTDVVAEILCSLPPSSGTSSVSYTRFRTVDDLRQEYESERKYGLGGEVALESGGENACPHEAARSLAGAVIGRVLCKPYGSHSLKLTWSDERFLILAEADQSNADVPALWRWWGSAGPTEPGASPTPEALLETLLEREFPKSLLPPAISFKDSLSPEGKLYRTLGGATQQRNDELHMLASATLAVRYNILDNGFLEFLTFADDASAQAYFQELRGRPNATTFDVVGATDQGVCVTRGCIALRGPIIVFAQIAADAHLTSDPLPMMQALTAAGMTHLKSVT